MDKKSSNKRNIAFTWGWSGWHILPIVSLLRYIDTQEDCRSLVNSVYWFGEKKSMEYDFYESLDKKLVHIRPQFVPILAGKYRRETIWISRWRNLRDLFLFPCGILQSLFFLLRYRIDVVFCKWWYVSLPVVIAAWIARKKIIVHDSDTTPWLTNRLASRFAFTVFSGFPDTLPNAIAVGQILSDQLLDNLLTEDAHHTQKDTDTITVLVAWGSLGAKKLYWWVLDAIKKLWKQSEHYSFVFINGKKLIEESELMHNHKNIRITDLIKNQAEMGELYASADLAIVRGGTSTLAECKLFDLPLAIIPLPVTHDQAKNAQYYVDTYKDTMIDQNDPNFVSLLQDYILQAKQKSKQYNLSALSNTLQCAKKIIVKELLA